MFLANKAKTDHIKDKIEIKNTKIRRKLIEEKAIVIYATKKDISHETVPKGRIGTQNATDRKDRVEGSREATQTCD